MSTPKPALGAPEGAVWHSLRLLPRDGLIGRLWCTKLYGSASHPASAFTVSEKRRALTEEKKRSFSGPNSV